VPSQIWAVDRPVQTLRDPDTIMLRRDIDQCWGTATPFAIR